MEQHQDPDKLLRVPAIAAWLDCSESNIYALTASGELKAYRVGKGNAGLRFSEAQVLEFLRKRETGGQTPENLPAPSVQLKHLHH